MGYRFYFQDLTFWVASLRKYVPLCKGGCGVPIFLMICSTNVDSEQEAIPLSVCLWKVFKHSVTIHPKALMIDKSPSEYNAFRDVINQNPLCWESVVIDGYQKHRHFLPCHFHAKQTWIEHLLPKIQLMQLRKMYI